MFARCDVFFPLGARCWWLGTPIITMLRPVGRSFDGANDDESGTGYRAR